MENQENSAITNDTVEQQEQIAKTYTEDEVLKMVQSEADRRVNQALEKQKKHYEKELSLSSLDEEAREKASKDMRIQELEEKLREFNVLQTKSEVVKVLNDRGLNSAFADILDIGEDKEVAQKNIETLDKLFKSAVQEEVKKRLSSNIPSIGSDKNGTLTKEDFKKMNLSQRTALYQSNPDLYKELSK